MATRASTGVGTSLECTQGAHHQCQQAGCRCLCHYPAKDLLQRTEVQPVDEPPLTKVVSAMVCPRCAVPPKFEDKFCRRDGQKLVAGGFCGACQAVVFDIDQYCFNCGARVNG